MDLLERIVETCGQLSLATGSSTKFLVPRMCDKKRAAHDKAQQQAEDRDDLLSMMV